LGHFQCSHLHSRLPGLPLFLRIFALSLFSPSAIGLAQTYGVQILSRTVSRRNRAVDFPQRNGWSVLFFSSGKARDERPLESKTLNKLFQYVSKNTNRFFETFHPWIRSTHIEKKKQRIPCRRLPSRSRKSFEVTPGCGALSMLETTGRVSSLFCFSNRPSWIRIGEGGGEGMGGVKMMAFGSKSNPTQRLLAARGR